MNPNSFDQTKETDGVESRLHEKSKTNAELVAAALKEDADKDFERRKEQVRKQMQKDAYEKEFDLLKQRFVKKESEIQTEKLKAVTEENKWFTDGVVTIDEHKANLDKIRERERESLTKLKEEYGKLFRNLRDEKPDGYYMSGRSWDVWNGQES